MKTLLKRRTIRPFAGCFALTIKQVQGAAASPFSGA
jgi:hypothetical protein